MITWASDQLPATTTWFTLRTLGQIPETVAFADSKGIKMSELRFYSQTSSADARKVQAGSLASMLDRTWRNFWGARLKDNMTPITVAGTLAEVLVNGDNTLFILASTMDDNYQF